MLPTALSLGHYGEWFLVVAATIPGEHRMLEKYPTLEGLGFSDTTLCGRLFKVKILQENIHVNVGRMVVSGFLLSSSR